MFHKARIRLTFWYLLIIMAISIFFSAFIYFGATQEFDRIIRMQEYRTQHPEVRVNFAQRNPFIVDQFPDVPQPDIDVIEEAKLRVLGGLIGINIIILMLSSLAGYFLAGRTLRPVKEMVDEQNRFITDASHELNTPLTSLKTSIEVNLRDKKFNLEKAKKVLSGNLDDIDNLQFLSDQLIRLTQYQKPNGNFKLDKVEISAVINSSYDKVKSFAQKKQVNFSINTTKNIILGDKKSLTELFVILFDNAIKYSKENKPVKVRTYKTDSKIEIWIEDEGIGIAKEDLPYIFDRFYRADKSRTKQQIPGYGLGLSIAKRIVALHNGTIGVDSVLGKKTIFKITFPIA